MAANAESAISQGALRQIHNGEAVDSPVLQCLQIKHIPSGQDRFRVVYSDVNNFIQSMLASQLNHLVHSSQLRKGVFVRIKNYQTNLVKGKIILIALELDVLEELGEREKIGNPEALEGKDAPSGNASGNVASANGGFKQEQEEKKPANFYGKPQPQEQQKQQQQQQSRSMPSRSNGDSSSFGNVYPIEALSPYAHKWTVKVRCTNKSDIKTWHKASGEGKLFSVTFLDETGEIRATGFNDQCDALYDIFQEGSVYYISSPCRVQLAKKQFSNVNNDYELTFERDTVVEKAEDQDNVPQVRFNFTNVGDLQQVEKDTTIDTIAILKEVGEVSQITSKTTSKPYDKRELTLVDDTGYSVRLTIWGNSAQSFDVEPESVVAFKGVKVSDFGGRSLSLLSSGSMNVNPDIDEAHKLKGWYEAQGRQDSFTSHAAVMGTTGGAGRKDVYKTIANVKDEGLGMSTEVDYFTLKATVIYIKSENVAYAACQSADCNKKVIETEEGRWRCEKCDKAWDRPQYRYILQANVSDHTGQLWVSGFDDTGRLLIGMSADDLMNIKENDDRQYTDKIGGANCNTWVFRCRAKLDTFQDQQRVRYQISSASPVNFSQEANRLAAIIKQYDIDADNNLFVS